MESSEFGERALKKAISASRWSLQRLNGGYKCMGAILGVVKEKFDQVPSGSVNYVKPGQAPHNLNLAFNKLVRIDRVILGSAESDVVVKFVKQKRYFRDFLDSQLITKNLSDKLNFEKNATYLKRV